VMDFSGKPFCLGHWNQFNSRLPWYIIVYCILYEFWENLGGTDSEYCNLVPQKTLLFPSERQHVLFDGIMFLFQWQTRLGLRILCNRYWIILCSSKRTTSEICSCVVKATVNLSDSFSLEMIQRLWHDMA
jgi:hypothetical protein